MSTSRTRKAEHLGRAQPAEQHQPRDRPIPLGAQAAQQRCRLLAVQTARQPPRLPQPQRRAETRFAHRMPEQPGLLTRHHPLRFPGLSGPPAPRRPQPRDRAIATRWGNPRQLGQPVDQTTLMATAKASGRIPSSANRIGLTQALLDQEVVSRTGTNRCCRVAFDKPAPESIDTTLGPGGWAARSTPRT